MFMSRTGWPALHRPIGDSDNIQIAIGSIEMKTCCKCKLKKSKTEFSAKKSRKDGLYPSCRACNAIYGIVYRKANAENIKAYMAAHYKANFKKLNAKNAAWRKANPEYMRGYYAANPEKMKVIGETWRKANPESQRIREHNRRARKRVNGGKLSPDLSAKLYKLQRGKCPCCKKPLGDDYHMDHIVPIKLGGANIDSNIQLLRQRCNNQKSAKHPIAFMQSRGFLL